MKSSEIFAQHKYIYAPNLLNKESCSEIVSEFKKVADTDMRDLFISNDGKIVFRGMYGDKQWYYTVRIIDLKGKELYRFDKDLIVDLYLSYDAEHIAITAKENDRHYNKMLNKDFSGWKSISPLGHGLLIDSHGGVLYWADYDKETRQNTLFYSHDGETHRIIKAGSRSLCSTIYDHFRDLWGKGYFVLGDLVGKDREDYVSFSGDRPLYARIDIYHIER